MSGTPLPPDPAPSAPAGGAPVPGPAATAPAPVSRRVVGTSTLVAFILVTAAGSAVIALYRSYLRTEARTAVATQAAVLGQALSATIAQRVAILLGFENLLRLQGNGAHDARMVEEYATLLRGQASGIRALQLVRGGRITVVAPRQGNEAALGLDLLNHPNQEIRSKYLTSVNTDSVTLTGPIALAQGGTGLVIRRRFSREGFPGHDLAALVLDLPPLIRDAGLASPAGLRIAVRDDDGPLIHGDSTLAQQDPVVVPVALPGDEWRIEAVPTSGWEAAIGRRLSLFSAGVVLSGILLVLVTYLTASRQQALAGAVEARTRSLNDAIEELRRAVSSRDESEARLRQVQRLESLGRFAGGIAHDFNNLLTVIIGSIALARLELAPEGRPEVETDLAAAEQAAQRARELTRKLLAFARQREIEAQVLDLNALLEEIQPILRRLLSERIRLVLEAAPGLWPIFADPGQMEQVVTNLVVNAGDALPEGGEIRLRTWNFHLTAGALGAESLQPGDYVCLAVEDNGTGMSPEVLQRAFDPFFTTKEMGKGTGLGLATVYGIARQAGGDVQLQSELGRGTRAILRLPRTTAEIPQRVERPPAPIQEASGGETVLLVEDDMNVRRVVSRILGGAGYRLIAAEDGDSALRRLDPDQRVDLLITDVVTPGLGGRALAERILARDPGTRVLFISGYAADERFADLLARPGIAYLAKPFTIPQLQGVVRQLLGHPHHG